MRCCAFVLSTMLVVACGSNGVDGTPPRAPTANASTPPAPRDNNAPPPPAPADAGRAAPNEDAPDAGATAREDSTIDAMERSREREKHTNIRVAKVKSKLDPGFFTFALTLHLDSVIACLGPGTAARQGTVRAQLRFDNYGEPMPPDVKATLGDVACLQKALEEIHPVRHTTKPDDVQANDRAEVVLSFDLAPGM